MAISINDKNIVILVRLGRSGDLVQMARDPRPREAWPRMTGDAMLIATSAEFIKKIPTHSRLLGLDVGEVTIGLALSDVMRTIATPHSTIARRKFTHDVEALKTIVAAQSVGGLIIGYPLNMDGSLGPRTQSVRTFVSNLGKHISLPMFLSDERMSTMAVERTMLAADLSRERREQLVDKLAASYILQGFLDGINRI